MKVKKDLLIGIVLGALVTWAIVSSFMILRQNKLLEDRVNKVENQSELVASVRMNSFVFLMSNLLNRVDDELKNNPKRTLSNGTIGRIAALSQSLKPYGNLQGDSLSKKRFSPERGQLLTALTFMNIDSSSFSQIKNRATFSGADLRGADLNRADLRGVNLRWANLSEANLWQADLRDADLSDAVLWGINLAEANLSGAYIERSDLRWANLNGAVMKKAELGSADLTNTKLKNADLSEVQGKLAYMRSAFFNNANMRGIDLEGTDLSRANLSKANLSEANLWRTDMRETDLSYAVMWETNLVDANLNGANIENENWFEKLSDWQVKGLEEIQSTFKIAGDKSAKNSFRIEKIED